MKKIVCIAVATLMAVVSAQADDPQAGAAEQDSAKIGVGFQGVFIGDLLPGAAIRMAPDPVGFQIEASQGSITIDPPGPGFDADMTLFILKGKVYKAVVERENSCFYLGASIGYFKAQDDLLTGGADIDGWSLAPLVGAEWNFSDLPELGFNFEISYEMNDLKIDPDGGGASADLGIKGITVSTGVIYYF